MKRCSDNSVRDSPNVTKWRLRAEEMVSKLFVFFWCNLHLLQRLTWLVEKTKERTTEQCSQLTLKNNTAAGYQATENRAFERFRSTDHLS